MNDLYVIIINYNSASDSIECISEFEGFFDKRIRCIVVDNESTDDSRFVLKKTGLFSAVSENCKSKIVETSEYNNFLVLANKNYGYAGGVNIVLSVLLEYNITCQVLLLNPDIRIDKKSIMEMARVNNSIPDSCVGASVYSYCNRRTLCYYGGAYLTFYGKPKYTRQKNKTNDFLAGGCILFHSDVIRINGLFPCGYFLYWEEADWCVSFVQKKGKMLVAYNAIAYDKGGVSINRKSSFAHYHYTYGAILFITKYRKNRLIYLYVWLFIKILANLLLGKKDVSSSLIKAIKDCN